MTKRKGKGFVGGYRKGQSSQDPAERSKAARPKRPPLTHFLCFPLVTEESRPQLEASLLTFRNAISNNVNTASAAGIDRLDPHVSGLSAAKSPEKADPPLSSSLPDKAVRLLGTLHLTLGVMSLTTDDRVQSAIDLLNSLLIPNMLEGSVPTSNDPVGIDRTAHSTDERAGSTTSVLPGIDQTSEQSQAPMKVPSQAPSSATEKETLRTELSTEPIIVSLKSLLPMQAVEKTSVLYAAPEPSERLLRLGSHLQSVFTQHEYMEP